MTKLSESQGKTSEEEKTRPNESKLVITLFSLTICSYSEGAQDSISTCAIAMYQL